METKIKVIPIMKSEPVEPFDADGVIKKPAVTFEPNHIACGNGTKVKNDVYKHFLDVNSECLYNTALALRDNVNPEFAANSVDMLSYCNAKVLVDSFTSSIGSYYMVFISKVNEMIKDIAGENANTMKTTIRCWGRYERYLFDGLQKFTNCSVEERNTIVNTGAFVDYCIGLVNILGSNAYSDAIDKICVALSDVRYNNCTVDPDSAIAMLNQLFCVLMADMTYEVSAFNNNMKAYHGLIFSSNEIDEIAHLDNSGNGTNYRVDDDQKFPFINGESDRIY